MEVIGIAGGSGAGKSTVSYALVDADPHRFEVVNLDDYQKVGSKEDLPKLEGITNWDHPDVIRWDDLRNDIATLRAGDSVTLDVWAHRSNPDYAQHRQMIPRTIQPRPVIIVEGYLALHAEMDGIYDTSFYLDLDDDARAQRRLEARGGVDNIIGVDDYVEKVLKPMHAEHVEPTKQNADYVVDVSDMTFDNVSQFIREHI